MSGLAAAERIVVESLRAHIAHGYGEILIVITEGNVDVREGKRTRIKIPTSSSRDKSA